MSVTIQELFSSGNVQEGRTGTDGKATRRQGLEIIVTQIYSENISTGKDC